MDRKFVFSPCPPWLRGFLTSEVFVAPALLLALVLVVYWRLAFTDGILVGYDLFTYFYPQQAYAAAALRAGKLPLWNPYLFGGVPFLANIQTALFYPLNLPTYLLDPPQATKLSILLHVWLAGCFAYALARAGLRLLPLAALVAALAYMFSGFISAQVGHVNQLNAAAWLPLLVLCYALAWRRRDLRLAVAGGLVLGVQLLAGHSQESYLSLVVVGSYALFAAARELARLVGHIGEFRISNFELRHWEFLSPFRSVLLPLVWLGTMVAVGVGLAAVQLLPTLELTQQSIRQGGLAYREAVSFSLPPWQLARALLPGYLSNPFSEFVGYVGLLPLALALLALAARPRHALVIYFVLLALGALFLALGGYNPLYERLYRRLPGLAMFRVPARWLFVYTFAVAMLAGLGMDFWLRPALRPLDRRAALRWAMRILLALLLLAGLLGLVWPLFSPPQPEVQVLWLVAGLVLLVALVLSPFASGRPRLGAVLVGLIVAELFSAGADLEYNHLTLPQAYSSLRPAVAQMLADDGLFRVLSVTTALFEPGDAWDLRGMLADVLPRPRIDDLIIAHKYKEILAPNLPLRYGIASLDGYDGGVLPLRRYVELKPLLLASGGVRRSRSASVNPNQPDALLREQLAGLPESRLLGLLNVKYVIADRAHDLWRDGAYYDLGTPVTLAPGGSLRLATLPRLAATAVGLVTHLQGAAALADGTPVAEVVMRLADGRTVSLPLRAGLETAEGAYQRAPVRHQQPKAARPWEEETQGTGFDYVALLALPELSAVQEVEIRSVAPQGQLLLRALSLLDERTGASEPVAVNQRWRVVHLGDVKIYENLDFLPRAFLVDRYALASNAEETLAALRSAVQERAVLRAAVPELAPSTGETSATAGEGTPGEAAVISYEPERVVVRARALKPALLLLTDAYYPGWRAFVDGTEVEVRQADHLFRAVYLSPGEHRVEFVYRPLSLALGAGLSVGTVVVALALILGRRGVRLLGRGTSRVPRSAAPAQRG